MALICVFLADVERGRANPPPRGARAEASRDADTGADGRQARQRGRGAGRLCNSRPYWIGLAQCGGIYFKLNTLYADIAAHARAVKPDPRLTTEYTKKLNDAIKTATAYFSGAEHLLMTDRGLERVDAVLIYDEQSRAAGIGSRLSTGR